MYKKVLFFLFLIFISSNSSAKETDKAYFGGGCFWCMEESFEKAEGVIEVISGYSGGTTENPTYKEVTYGDTGHFEVVEIIYDKSLTNYKKLLEIFWLNIDPFDAKGQFCDKGESYKSVVFYENNDQKKIIETSIKNIEKRFNRNVVTYVKSFKEFYMAETYHQDYYEKNFIRYLMYKKGCQREEVLNKIWG